MITINLEKAKIIAHDYRRKARTKEFAPLDIQATIPSQAQQAETARQEVRDRYAALQNQVDTAQDIGSLKNVTSIFVQILFGAAI